MLQYKLRTATVAVCQGTDSLVAITIPCGAILKVADNLVNVADLVEADWDGVSVQIFSADLVTRGELLKVRRVRAPREQS